MSFAPTISVVIPTYNRVNELRRALVSVLNQVYMPTEIWVVDDCSEDDIQGLLKEFSDFEINYHHLAVKSNANVARNAGAEMSSSKFIAFLDSDDEWMKNHLLDFVESYDSKYQGFFSNSMIIRNSSDEPIRKNSKKYSSLTSALNFLLDGGFAQTSSFIIAEEQFSNCKFDPSLIRHQDYDFFVRFHQLYTWKQLNHFSVVIHWEEGRIVNRDYQSEMRFITKNREMISPKVYKRYIRNQYDFYFSIGETNALPIYQNELIYITHLINFSEFKSFYKEFPDYSFRNGLLLLKYIKFYLKSLKNNLQ
jgi:glycosyltransferase involved in cell wall biosynthesis